MSFKRIRTALGICTVFLNTALLSKVGAQPLAPQERASTGASPISILSPVAGAVLPRPSTDVRIALGPNVANDQINIRLNGQDVSEIFYPESDCRHGSCILRAHVSMSSGIATGPNTLEVRYRNGMVVSSTAKSRFFAASLLEGTTVVALAGPDQTVSTNHPVHLNGTLSTGTAPLTYEWSVVTPTGSAVPATLQGATPQFVPDVQGTYAVTLTVMDPQGGADKSSLTIYAQDRDAKIRLITRALCAGCNPAENSNYYTQINGERYKFPAGPLLEALSVVVLNRHTGAPVPNGAQTFNDLDALTAFLNQTAPDDKEMVVFGSGVSGSPFTPSELAPLLSAFGASGAFAGLPDNASFSLIGVRGMAAGQAWEVGFGVLAGSLVQDSQQNYTFVQFDYVPFQVIPGISSPAQVTLLKNTVASDAPQAGFGGFFLVVVDRATLAIVFQHSYETLSPDADTSIANQNAMTAQLKTYEQDFSKLIIIASYGSPHNGFAPDDASEIPYGNLALELAAFGATNDAILNLNVSDTYSVISWNGSANEASSVITPTIRAGIQNGYVGRENRGNWYRPLVSAFSLDTNLGLYDIVARPTSNWPLPRTSGQQNAYRYINAALCFCSDLRSGYSDTNISVEAWAVQLSVLPYQNDPKYPFTQQDFSSMQSQLLTELAYVAHIRNFNNNLQTLWTDQQINFTLLVNAVGTDVKQALKPPPTSIISELESTAINKIFSIAGDLLGDVPGASQAVGILQSVLNFTGVLAKTPAGQDAAFQVDTTVADLETKTAYGFTQQLSSLGNLFGTIYQDWGKVRDLGQHLSNPDDAGWRWNGSTTTGQLLNIMTYAMERSLYSNIAPAAVAVVNGTTGIQFPDQLTPGFWGYKNWPAEEWTWVYYPALTSDWNTTYRTTSWIVELNPKGDPLNSHPDPGIFQHLLAPLGQGGLEVYKPDIFRHWPMKQYACEGTFSEVCGKLVLIGTGH